VLARGFEAPAPNRKWIADFIYIWTAEGWLYVAAVIDLFSRPVVGWSMSAEMTAQLVTDALIMAIWRRGKPDALLHHSDRGSGCQSARRRCEWAVSGFAILSKIGLPGRSAVAGSVPGVPIKGDFSQAAKSSSAH